MKGHQTEKEGRAFFTNRTISHGNNLPREVVESLTLDALKIRLDRVSRSTFCQERWFTMILDFTSIPGFYTILFHSSILRERRGRIFPPHSFTSSHVGFFPSIKMGIPLHNTLKAWSTQDLRAFIRDYLNDGFQKQEEGTLLREKAWVARTALRFGRSAYSPPPPFGDSAGFCWGRTRSCWSVLC